MPDGGSDNGFKYWAFISYSHADKYWGDWLHRALETYRVPRRLVGTITPKGESVPARVYPIFRDREELPVSASLPENINSALEQSRFLIVVCSPRSAASRWVNEEIKTFKRLGREDRVLALIVAGEPNASEDGGKPGFRAEDECFPQALRYRWETVGRLSDERTEPIAADARADKDGKRNAKLKLLAGLLCVQFDELRQRDHQRRVRRMIYLAASVVMLLAVLTTLTVHSIFQSHRAELALAKARAQQQRASANEEFAAEQYLANDQPGVGLAYLARACMLDSENASAQTYFWVAFVGTENPDRLPDEVWNKNDPHLNGKLSPGGKRILTSPPQGGVELHAFTSLDRVSVLVAPEDKIAAIDFSPMARYVVAYDGVDTLRFWDSRTGQEMVKITSGALAKAELAWTSHDDAVGSVTVDGVFRAWKLPSGEPLPHTAKFPSGFGVSPVDVRIAAAGRYCYTQDAYGNIALYDLQADTVLRNFVARTEFYNAAFSGDGEYLAFNWTHTSPGSSPSEPFAIWDCQRGRQITTDWKPNIVPWSIVPAGAGFEWEVIEGTQWIHYAVQLSGSTVDPHYNLVRGLIVDMHEEFCRPTSASAERGPDSSEEWVSLRLGHSSNGDWEVLRMYQNNARSFDVWLREAGANVADAILEPGGRWVMATWKDGRKMLWDLRSVSFWHPDLPPANPDAPTELESSTGFEIRQLSPTTCRVREQKSGRWVTKALHYRDHAPQVRWSTDGQAVEFEFNDENIPRYQMPIPSLQRAPSWLETFCGAAAGYRFNLAGQPERIPLDERLRMRDGLRNDFAAGKFHNDGDPKWERLLEWWLTPTIKRGKLP